MSEPIREPELIPPRADEQLEVTRLEPWLRARLPATDGPLEVAQFAGGRANLTYLLRFGVHEYVLRRPPLGPVAPGAHDMGREHRVLSRLAPHFALAPHCHLHCDDESLIGAPFQVMERRHGRVLRKPLPADVATRPEICRRVGEMLVDALAALHRVDRVAAGLEDLGRPEGFVARQLAGWTRRWHGAAHEENREMLALVTWLERGTPDSTRVALLHNDYKLDNVMVAADDPGRAVAILDWDMCTTGDPLMDVGYLLNQWVEPGDPPRWIEDSATPTATPGFPSRAEAIARYADATGIEVGAIDWYHAFAAMKFAVIIQQIFIRYHRGQTRDERFAHYDERARSFVRKGCAIAGLAAPA
ncbi:MAG: phosphotransferase family protein [Ectothiorhodospiraceae bacterium]|nr:phosphotransferase family protein [Ectothiorhodospiraceae bacterium]